MNRDADSLFLAARSRSDAERAAFLDGACGDDRDLRAKVDALLSADEEAGSFLVPNDDLDATIPQSRPAGSLSAGPERAGQVIGRYKLLQQIGEGGFGSVFMAEQQKPVQRKVALKIIKLGMDTRQVVARFEQERQALALMDHPNIAKVLDAGATETGRPYFVMELVKGEPIVEYCDRNNLNISDRLVLFDQACSAIQHAHSKGVIHRDIKPSNILVSTQDGRPNAKVIDFGIAKATASKLTEMTLFTEHQQLIGTPQYMSPEQAEGSLDIDTRTDVYSLGVLLYELLTGTTPFSPKELRAAGYAEIQRIIREVEPPRPSTRLSQNMATLASVAAQRKVEPKRLGVLVRGELDWIVMKALEKDRQRRYETANGLAMDIRRYLAGEAVVAAPPSTAYRFRKFIRRNRVMVTAGSAVAVALLIGAIAFAWQASVAREQRDIAVVAQQAEAVQRKQADAARAEAQTQQARAEAQEAEARRQEAEAREQEAEAKKQAAIAEAVAKFQTDMLAAVDPTNLPKDPATGEPLKDALTVVQAMAAAVKVLDEGNLKDQPLVEARVRDTIGKTLNALARYDDAEPNLRKSLALRRAALPAGHPDIAASLNNLATLLKDQNRFGEAEPLYREALEIDRAAYPAGHPEIAAGLNNLGVFLHTQNRLDEAEPLEREALEIARAALPAGDPAIAASINNLASLLADQNKLAEAEPLLRESLEICRAAFPSGHPNIAVALTNLAAHLKAQNKFAEAEPYYREALDICRAAFPAGHPHIVSSLDNLAALLKEEDKFAEAEPFCREVLEIRRAALPAGHPDLARSLNNLASLQSLQNKFAEAAPLFREALEINSAALPAEHPELLEAKRNLAVLYWRLGKLDQSVPMFEELLKTTEALFGREHPETIMAVINLGVSYRDSGRLAEAIPLLEEAYRASERLPFVAIVRQHLLDAYAKAADPANPESIAKVRMLINELLADTRANLSKDSPDLARQLSSVSQTLLGLKAWDEAEPLVRECLAIREKTQPDDWATFNTKSMLGGVLLGQNKLAEAEPLLLDGYNGMKDREASIPPQGKARITEALERLVKLYEALHKAEPGKGHNAKAAEWRGKLEQTIDAGIEGKANDPRR